MTGLLGSPRFRVVKSVMRSPDFITACCVAIAAWIAAGGTPSLHESLVQLAPTLIGVFATLIGFVIAGQALAFALISEELRVVISLAPDGIRGIARPYKVVAAVSAMALASALWMLLTNGSVAALPWVPQAECAALGFFGAWAVGGATQLVWNGTHLLYWNHSLAENVEALKQRRAS